MHHKLHCLTNDLSNQLTTMQLFGLAPTCNYFYNGPPCSRDANPAQVTCADGVSRRTLRSPTAATLRVKRHLACGKRRVVSLRERSRIVGNRCNDSARALQRCTRWPGCSVPPLIFGKAVELRRFPIVRALQRSSSAYGLVDFASGISVHASSQLGLWQSVGEISPRTDDHQRVKLFRRSDSQAVAASTSRVSL